MTMREANERDERAREQLTVGLDPATRAELERVAQAEHRSVAGQVRHYVETALSRRDDRREPARVAG